MLGMRLVETAVQLDPSTGKVLFVVGVLLLVGILYYFMNHDR